MNYIKRLESEVDTRNEMIRDAYQEISELEKYLNSPKFRAGDALDRYVEIGDVLARLGDMKSALNYGLPA